MSHMVSLLETEQQAQLAYFPPWRSAQAGHKWFLGAFKILTQQVVKSMSRAVPVQNFPWPIVEHRLHTFNLAP